MEEDFTTFKMDFTIADRFGIEAIKDTYKRAFNELNNTNFKTNEECFYHEEEEKRIESLKYLYEIVYRKGVIINANKTRRNHTN